MPIQMDLCPELRLDLQALGPQKYPQLTAQTLKI